MFPFLPCPHRCPVGCLYQPDMFQDRSRRGSLLWAAESALLRAAESALLRAAESALLRAAESALPRAAESALLRAAESALPWILMMMLQPRMPVC